MSNFMHKVKDAMTDRDKDTDRYNEPGQDNYGSSNAPLSSNTDTKANNSSGRSSNPFGSTRSGDGAGHQTRFNEPQNVGEPANTRTGNQNMSGSSGPDPYAQSRAGGATGTTNAGPHDSNVANKLDPRVDSDMDNRANPVRTEGERPNVTHAQGFNPSNTTPRGQQQPQQQPQSQQSQQQQPGMQAFDNHKSSEENYSKSTQERSAHSQPGTLGSDQMTSQDEHSTSMQENKSHSTTSHAAPCQSNVGTEAGGMGGNAQPSFGGNTASGGTGGTAQPSFGGNAAAGGSSFGDNTGTGGRSGAQAQNADPMNKLDPRTTRTNEQQNIAGNQRGY